MAADDLPGAEAAWRDAEREYRAALEHGPADPSALHHLEDLREAADDARTRYVELCRRAGLTPEE